MQQKFNKSHLYLLSAEQKGSILKKFTSYFSGKWIIIHWLASICAAKDSCGGRNQKIACRKYPGIAKFLGSDSRYWDILDQRFQIKSELHICPHGQVQPVTSVGDGRFG